MNKTIAFIAIFILSSAMMSLFTGCASAANSEIKAVDVTENSTDTTDEDVTNDVEDTSDFDFDPSMNEFKTAAILANVAVHDPSIIEADGKYYIFGSHMSAAVSENLREWSYIGNGYKLSNPVFENLLDNEEAFAYAGSKHSIVRSDDGAFHVWAPDVIYNKAMEKYVMYFCTSSTWNASNLCMAVSDAIEGPYVWQAPLIYSGFTMNNIEDTDVLDYVSLEYAREHYMKSVAEYNHVTCPNAIDPTVFYDKEGKMWMVYGSWSGGIFLLEIDEKTGLVIHPEGDEAKGIDPYFGKCLLGGGHNSIEGPYIIYNEDTDYYELYVSYGSLTREGGYQIRMFRSKTVDGDYEDMNGARPVLNDQHADFGLKLSGNYILPSLPMAYMATGHNSAFRDFDGKRYICFHTRFDNKTEDHEPRVHQYFCNEEGWPCMLPYATGGESIPEISYSADAVSGRYYFINQGTYVSAKIATPSVIYLTEQGNIYDESGLIGSYTIKDNNNYVHLTMGDKEYSGIFCEMNDEAGKKVMTFSAVCENESIWGVNEDVSQ